VRVKKKPAGFRRRKLSAVVRKAITSYYTAQEEMEIQKAAEQQNISKSSVPHEAPDYGFARGRSLRCQRDL
jgi:hypothetical protein